MNSMRNYTICNYWSCVHRYSLLITLFLSFYFQISIQQGYYSSGYPLELLLSKYIENYIDDWKSTRGTESFETETYTAIPHLNSLTLSSSTSSYFYFESYDDSACSDQYTFSIGYPANKCLVLYSTSEKPVGSVIGECSTTGVFLYYYNESTTCAGTNRRVSAGTLDSCRSSSGIGKYSKLQCSSSTDYLPIVADSVVISGFQRGDTDCSGIPSIFASYNLKNCLLYNSSYFQLACSESPIPEYYYTSENITKRTFQSGTLQSQCGTSYSSQTLSKGCLNIESAGYSYWSEFVGLSISFSSFVTSTSRRRLRERFMAALDDQRINDNEELMYYYNSQTIYDYLGVYCYRIPPSPTSVPSVSPTATLTSSPSSVPSNSPSISPTATTTTSPSSSPTIIPSSAPTFLPSLAPSSIPSSTITVTPTVISTIVPSMQPSMIPSSQPSWHPSTFPTTNPSMSPSTNPTMNPSMSPSTNPTTNPSTDPTMNPSTDPTTSPSTNPTTVPTTNPTMTPTYVPTLSLSPTAAPSTATYSTLQVYAVVSDCNFTDYSLKTSLYLTIFQSSLVSSVSVLKISDIRNITVTLRSTVSLVVTERSLQGSDSLLLDYNIIVTNPTVSSALLESSVQTAFTGGSFVSNVRSSAATNGVTELTGITFISVTVASPTSSPVSVSDGNSSNDNILQVFTPGVISGVCIGGLIVICLILYSLYCIHMKKINPDEESDSDEDEEDDEEEEVAVAGNSTPDQGTNPSHDIVVQRVRAPSKTSSIVPV